MSTRELRLRDFPGMASVCLSHAMRWRSERNREWRSGGTADCCCELASDAVVRLRAEIEWRKQDEQILAADRRELEKELAKAMRAQ